MADGASVEGGGLRVGVMRRAGWWSTIDTLDDDGAWDVCHP